MLSKSSRYRRSASLRSEISFKTWIVCSAAPDAPCTREVETRYVRSNTGCANSSDSSPDDRQNGHEYDPPSVVSAISARILRPINSAGDTPIIEASDRLTRSTLSDWSCTTMKSEIASKISVQ